MVKTKYEMKKEWIFQIIVLFIFYLDEIVELDSRAIEYSSTPFIDLLFLLSHVPFYYFVAYILIPKFFYSKKYLWFVLALLGSILLLGIIEEGIIEKILTPNSRGRNQITFMAIYWVFVENFAPLLAVTTIKIMFDLFNHQQRIEQIEKDNLENELKFLKSQIQPHILFNSLNNLYDFTLSQSDKAPDLVLKLSNVLRYVLYETPDDRVPLTKEISFLQDYIELQKMQFEGRGKISFTLTEEHPEEHLKIAPFLLIPFIENSIKHSLGSKERDINVIIELWLKGNALQLLVENNYDKKPSTSNELMTKGIGLKNVRKRLELLYPDQHQLKIQQIDDDQNNIYKVQLNLNLT